MTRGLLVLPLLLSSCFSINRKLDEHIFYSGPQFRLKLSVHYERTYAVLIDERFYRSVVQCAPAGGEWVDVASAQAAKESARKIAAGLASSYVIAGERTLVWTSGAVNVTFDACRTFALWSPLSLPAEAIDPAPKPEHCSAPRVDCRWYDFMFDRVPSYANVRVEAPGTLSVRVRSKAFREGKPFDVRTTDYGRTWSAAPTDSPAAP